MAQVAKKLVSGRHASAIKRDRQNEKRHARNRHDISRMKTEIKKVRSENTPETLKSAQSVIAMAAKKGIIHKNKASRLISRLTKSVNKAV